MLPLAVLLLGLVVACGGDDNDSGDLSSSSPGDSSVLSTGAVLASDTSAPSGSTVVSAGGEVIVALPVGSDISDGSVQISTLPPDRWPPELSVVDARLVAEIGPDGAQFDVPVAIS